LTQDSVTALQLQVFIAKKGKKAAPASFNHTEGEIGEVYWNRFTIQDASRMILFHERNEVGKMMSGEL